MCAAGADDMTQVPESSPSSVAYDIAGDYFQVLCNISAAHMVRQQSFLIITLEWEYSS